VTEEVERIERDKGAALQFEDVRTLVEGKRGREAEARGDPDGGVWSAGQSVGLIGDIPSCASLVRSMVAEAERVIRSELQALLVAPAPRSRL
jgi:NAD(P)H-dependent flavin oxidoreductase YrpB (nitropropane dioxygenase family)